MQISCAVTAQLFSTFVFATQTAQSLFFLNPNFQASSLFSQTVLAVADLEGVQCVGLNSPLDPNYFIFMGNFKKKKIKKKLGKQIFLNLNPSSEILDPPLTGQFVSDLVENPEDWFSSITAHIILIYNKGKMNHILKTIKNATDIQVISTFQGHLVRYVYSEVSLPLARESFSEN